MACGGPRRPPVHHFARTRCRPGPAGRVTAGLAGYYACRKARASAAKSGVPRPVAGFHTRPGEPV